MADDKNDKKPDPAPAKPADASPAAPPPAAPAAPRVVPAKVRLTALYGRYDDNGRFQQWKEGDVVTDPAEVALLLDLQAPLFDETAGKPVPYEKDQPKKG